MRAVSTVWTLGFVVGLAAGAWAQAPAAGRSNQFVILGCVSREGPPAARGGQAGAAVFTLRDPRGEGTTYRLDGDAETLAWHVGHTLELRGSIPPAARGAAATTGLPLFTIASIVYLSPTCVYNK